MVAISLTNAADRGRDRPDALERAPARRPPRRPRRRADGAAAATIAGRAARSTSSRELVELPADERRPAVPRQLDHHDRHPRRARRARRCGASRTSRSRAGEHGYRAVEDFVATRLPDDRGDARLGDRARPAGGLRRRRPDDRAATGFAPFRGLAAYVGVAVLGLAIQVLVVYQAWIVLVARMSLRRFWSGARDAVVYALGIEQQPGDPAGHAPVPRPDEGLAPVGAAGGLRRDEPEQRRHPALRGDGRPLRRPGRTGSTSRSASSSWPRRRA